MSCLRAIIVAHLYSERPGGNFYIRSRVGGYFFKSLGTSGRRIAEAELAKRNAQESGRPWSCSGRARWRPEQWQRFEDMPGKTRVSKQNYAMAARALQVLKPESERLAWLMNRTRIVTLANLGRIEMPAMMMAAAAEINDKRIGAKPAMIFLRNLRGTSTRKPPTLGQAVCQLISRRFSAKPGREVSDVLEALAIDYRDRDRFANAA